MLIYISPPYLHIPPPIMIKKLPAPILHNIIFFLDDRRDLLAFALACRTFSRLILVHTRISCFLGEGLVWLYLQRNRGICGLVKELCTGDTSSFYSAPRPELITTVYSANDKLCTETTASPEKMYPQTSSDTVYNSEVTLDSPEVIRSPEGMALLGVPKFMRILPYLNNLTSVKFVLKSVDKMIVKKIMNTFALSSCVLEEFEVNIDWKWSKNSFPSSELGIYHAPGNVMLEDLSASSFRLRLIQQTLR